jgi:hypothetical protein
MGYCANIYVETNCRYIQGHGQRNITILTFTFTLKIKLGGYINNQNLIYHSCLQIKLNTKLEKKPAINKCLIIIRIQPLISIENMGKS